MKKERISKYEDIFFYSNDEKETGLAFHLRFLYIANVSKYKILLL